MIARNYNNGDSFFEKKLERKMRILILTFRGLQVINDEKMLRLLYFLLIYLSYPFLIKLQQIVIL